MLALLAVGGYASRTAPLATQSRFDVQSAEDVYRALVGTGARGRTVVLLDRSARSSGSLYLTSYLREASDSGSATVGVRNLVSALGAAGIAREVIVVLPPDEWAGFLGFAGSAPNLAPVAGGFRTRDLGLGITYTESQGLRIPDEPVILIVGDGVADAYPQQTLDRLMSPETSDIVVMQHGD